MCGINGLWASNQNISLSDTISKMNSSIAHRGPDDEGAFVEGDIGLGHRRLSIIDLSSAGHQPMRSHDKNLVLVFNGEIYNYLKLKAQLKEHYHFQTHTDTEIILAAYTRWGKECVNHFEGMFAFALWDKRQKELWLVRDRLGIKPIYFAKGEDYFVFSSEIRAILQSGLVKRTINADSLTDFLRYQTVHAPDTMVQDIQMIMPGQWITIGQNGVKKHMYWQINVRGKEPEKKTYHEVCQDIRDLLFKAVEKRLVADVPFGAFLSGGIDSSIVVGIMSQVMNQQVNTFSVSFEEEKFSERSFAQLIAKKFNTQHHDIILKANDFLELVPQALDAMDHPSGDGPNTYVVSKVTKAAGIDMALSGLGGDELFAGYKHFKWLHGLKQWGFINYIPLGIRQAMAQPLQVMPDVRNKKFAYLLQTDFSLKGAYPLTRAVLLDHTIKRLIRHEKLAENKVSAQLNSFGSNKSFYLSMTSEAEINSYLQNVLLRDTDQMSMAHALEVRVPFLDHHLVDYVIKLGDTVKYPSSPKKLLTDALQDFLPSEVVNRPKMGFVLPWDYWLKGELRSFTDLKLQALGERAFIDAAYLQKMWAAFLKGDKYITWARIWQLVVLEFWLEKHLMGEMGQ